MKRTFAATDPQPTHYAAPAKRPTPAPSLFNSSDYIMVVGESDFSFSLKLAGMVGGANILASTLATIGETARIYPSSSSNIAGLEKFGAIVNYELDCTTKKLMSLELQFDKVVFNFPETAIGPDELEPAIPYNQYLLAAFLHESARLLMPRGRIYIAIKTGWPFDEWNVKAQGAACQYLDLQEIIPLPAPGFPNYTPKCTSSDDSFDLPGSNLYVYQLKPKFDASALANTLRNHPAPTPQLRDFTNPRPSAGKGKGPTLVGGKGATAPVPTPAPAPVPAVGKGSVGAGKGKGGKGKGGKGQSAAPVAAPIAASAALRPPPGKTIKEFNFSHTYDKQGVVYYIGTVAGRGRWENPATKGLIKVTASSIKRGARNGAEICDHTFIEQIFYTDNYPGQYICIDLGKYSVSPTYYTFSHRCAMGDYFVRNWMLEGSRNGTDWTCIREHRDDQTLNGRAFSATWPVDGRGEFFSQFRIKLADRGNSRGSNALVVSCFEVYGTMAE